MFKWTSCMKHIWPQLLPGLLWLSRKDLRKICRHYLLYLQNYRPSWRHLALQPPHFPLSCLFGADRTRKWKGVGKRRADQLTYYCHLFPCSKHSKTDTRIENHSRQRLPLSNVPTRRLLTKKPCLEVCVLRAVCLLYASPLSDRLRFCKVLDLSQRRCIEACQTLSQARAIPSSFYACRSQSALLCQKR